MSTDGSHQQSAASWLATAQAAAAARSFAVRGVLQPQRAGTALVQGRTAARPWVAPRTAPCSVGKEV